MLRKFSISARFFLLMGITLLFLAGIILAFHMNAINTRDVAVFTVQEKMHEGQRQKIMVATHSMAVSLGAMVEGVEDPDERVDVLRAGVDGIRFEEDESGYYFIYDGTVNVALPPNKKLQGKDLADLKDPNGVALVSELYTAAKAGGGFVEYIWPKPGQGDQPKLSYAEMIPGTDYWVGTGVYIDNVDRESSAVEADISAKANRSLLFVLAGAGAVLVLVFLPLNWAIVRSINRPIRETAEASARIADGDLDVSLDEQGRDEISSMQAAFNRMLAMLRGKAELAERIAERDLSGDVVLASEHDGLGRSLDKMTRNLRQLIGQVNEVAAQIADGSQQVADSSQDLSQGATEQAASLEEITSSMGEVGSSTRTSAENAGQANRSALEQRDAANKGAEEMQEMVSAMAEIEEASQGIAKIIKVIDEIAFQTNLLALNAAVEAARAGRHGKGFAVVAEEVRSLAGRSAKAAKETEELIQGAVDKISRGTGLAESTAQSLTRIVEESEKVATLIREIDEMATQQAEAISQVNEGMSQVEQVTQKNTATAEETAAAAEELSSQSDYLRNALAQFQLSGTSRTAALEEKAPPALESGPEPEEQQGPAPSGWDDMDEDGGGFERY